MKKLFLLLAVGSIAMNSGAQELQRSVVSTSGNMPLPVSFTKLNPTNVQPLGAAHKTTAGGDRWYNYANYIDTLSNYNQLNTSLLPNAYSTEASYLWNDTTSQDAYSGGTIGYNTLVSLGTVLDPKFSGFNAGYLYDSGSMKVGAGDAYIVDTVIVVGAYGTNPARLAAGVVDTLILSVVSGSGSSGVGSSDVYSDKGISGTHWGSPTWMDVNYDSTGLNCADDWVSSTHFIARIPMGGGSGTLSKDTLSATSTVFGYDNVIGTGIGLGSYYKKVALTAAWPGASATSGPVSVAAGGLVGITVSFKSGDASFHAGDQVFTATPSYNFSMLRPLITFLGTAATPAYPILNAGDNNVGLFKTLPDTARGWAHQYLPEWAWTGTGGGAADLQNPYIWAHITCASCGVTDNSFLSAQTVASVVNSVNVYPNPTSGDVNISYTLTQATDISVSLTNMVGQVVDSKTVTNSATGSVAFSTTNLPDGVYIYTLQANGNRTTGRVVVAK